MKDATTAVRFFENVRKSHLEKPGSTLSQQFLAQGACLQAHRWNDSVFEEADSLIRYCSGFAQNFFRNSCKLFAPP